MEKVLNRISSLLLLLTIAGSYLMWIVGIDTKVTAFIYTNSLYFLIIVIGLVLLLNVNRLEKSDWAMIGLALFFGVFYTLTSSMRHSNRFINATIPIIILLVLCFKICQFDRIDKGILFSISIVSLFATLYRLSVELPKLDMIDKNNNKLAYIWINTNTIGAALLFSILMVVILIQATPIGYYKIIVVPIYIAGLASMWIIESKTSFLVLILFIVINTSIPKKILQKNKWWVLLFLLIFLIMPSIFYYCANSSDLNLFTERERIWNEFFGKWLSSNQNIWIGMTPFVASWKPLGTHNSFLNILGNFGILGYILITGYFSYYFVRFVFSKKLYTKFQVGLLLAFLVIFVHSFMEDTLTAYHWMPILYSFIGISLQCPDDNSSKALKKK
ncbi:EpaQ family protein [Candidatus Enterococcus mansonii]|uniref:Uncharacterized protein n=1 Tax=Candidatus Enterococcus mansonii TaxID=1834181 RepID=A0A242CHM3_9ENTE|nr:EpaQ family protein [Enterococcus sp. 4G2_DIV0659]OTO09743.1 hypothetical protein A5880_000424 [Enterococcus sp. 4G2_DIV0659]